MFSRFDVSDLAWGGWLLLTGMTDALVSIIDTALTSVDESLAKLWLGYGRWQGG